MLYELKKRDFKALVDNLLKKNEVVYPVMTDALRFDNIKDASKVDVDIMKKLTYMPAKYMFFKRDEPIFRFDKTKIEYQPMRQLRQRIIFGLKKCELNSIQRQDMVFKDIGKDPHYMVERDRTLLVGYHCKKEIDRYCFCTSVDQEDCFDIMFYEKFRRFLVEAGTTKGKKFIAKHSKFFKQTKYKLKPKDKKIKVSYGLEKKDIGPYYDNPLWKRAVDLCISCGACVTLCPSCYCWEFKDKVSFKDPKKGKRIRSPSNCQFKCFTEVAGGHTFREKREERYKHRIYHQLKYFKDEHGKTLCSGCGRCIRSCPTRIEFVELLNEMK